jgi:hypothetical protein
MVKILKKSKNYYSKKKKTKKTKRMYRKNKIKRRKTYKKKNKKFVGGSSPLETQNISSFYGKDDVTITPEEETIYNFGNGKVLDLPEKLTLGRNVVFDLTKHKHIPYTIGDVEYGHIGQILNPGKKKYELTIIRSSGSSNIEHKFIFNPPKIELLTIDQPIHSKMYFPSIRNIVGATDKISFNIQNESNILEIKFIYNNFYKNYLILFTLKEIYLGFKGFNDDNDDNDLNGDNGNNEFGGFNYSNGSNDSHIDTTKTVNKHIKAKLGRIQFEYIQKIKKIKNN